LNRILSREFRGKMGCHDGLDTADLTPFAKSNMSQNSTIAAPLIERLALGDVASTSLMTLLCRARESESENPILVDPVSVRFLEGLIPVLADSSNPLFRSAAAGEVDSDAQTYVAMRARRFDRYALDFLARHSGGAIVNLGCGFDTRRFRLGIAGSDIVDLDLPEIIDARKRLLDEGEGGQLLASSVMDFDWIERLNLTFGRAVQFLAEGLLMYLTPDELQRLVLKLRSSFPGCELVGEVFNSFWLRGSARAEIDGKLRRKLHFGAGAMFKSGLSDSREMEGWGDGIEFVDEWRHFDESEPKLGRLRKLRHFPLFRRMQWTVRYRLGMAE
jgi:methyltransferase (TIGR00027 family)